VQLGPWTADDDMEHRLSFATWTFVNRYTATAATVLRPSFRDHPGEPVPEKNLWTSWCKGRLKEADTLTIRLGATPSGLTSAHLHHSPIFLQAGCPAAQPTVSKH